MPTDTPDIAVLDHDAHGIPASEYADVLRRRLPDHAVALAETPSDRRRLLETATVVAGGGLDEDDLAAAENLRLFACNSAGVEHLPLDALAERGVAVTNASGVHGPNIAEHVLGWVLMFARRLDEGRRRQERREWRRFQSFTELAGSTVTVVGLGSIGEAIVRRFSGFDVTTVGVRHTPSKGGPTDEVLGYDDLDDALARTDVLVLSCPLTETTEGLIGETELGILSTDAVLVNVARGGVVDTEALVGALQTNKIHGAALDVTDPEPLPTDHDLWGFENVFLTPHVSGHTPKYWERRADILAENLERVAESGAYENLRNQVA
ncbi:D-2-hydroxyacid dehydrogenase [Haloarcula nitratireducens]|uniref:D-2-hydroxyacid dehydrogenase n=1 Tax=Haloarcula nitratireducens TaxID=2487749 RepID=A0AAW4P5Y4_9EURY|nr:D-2-hydroxyacid dehydrogenase [Halomicroarcula nitratireducens]MBX0293279.1 D-2-hydroxyacid dehydrogenase [Halomicroarcula nitratireducens]